MQNIKENYQEKQKGSQNSIKNKIFVLNVQRCNSNKKYKLKAFIFFII